MKTVDEILREMRKMGENYSKSESNDCRYVAYWLGTTFADRIEAAVKHQFRDVTKMIPHEEVGVSKMETTTKESLVVGNAAEMRDAANSELLNSIKSYQINSSKAREALEEIRAYVADMVCRSERNESLRKAIYNSARYALSAPPRNCDVGTTKEQSLRFEDYCYRHRSCEKGCEGCPLLNCEQCCELAWGQMPYESEVK